MELYRLKNGMDPRKTNPWTLRTNVLLEDYYTKTESTFPKVRRARLLTKEELDTYNRFVRVPREYEPLNWYLADVQDGGILYACCYQTGGVLLPYLGNCVDGYPWGIGLRPVLEMESPFAGTVKLEPGDLLCIRDWFDREIPSMCGLGCTFFTVLSDRLLLCDSYIGSTYPVKHYGVYGETCDYATSNAKRRIDTWFAALKEQENIK